MRLFFTFGAMDRLRYTYSGNRLTNVADTVTTGYDVDLIPNGSGNYTYYNNGSLKTDDNSQITNISYNSYLNQPDEITLTSSGWIKYTYNGNDELLKAEYNTGEYWEYVDVADGVPFVFKNGGLYQLSIPDGRAVYSGGSWIYEFDYKDHLGNTRVSFRANGTTLEKTAATDFDPWGVRLNGTGAMNAFQNRFELQGHEKEATFNLNRVNFGARVYNPTIGRFDKTDPMATAREWVSTYNYVQNNPINRIDPDGAFDDYVLTANGSIDLVKKTDDNFDRITSTKNPENSITVAKGFLGNKALDINQTNFSYTDDPAGRPAQEIFVTANSNDASRVFEFASENSNVEFSLSTIEKNGVEVSVLSTSHRAGSVSVSHLPKLENKGFDIKELKHSHPGGPGTPSGFNDFGKIDPNARKRGDLNAARDYPKATHSVYDTKTKKYTRYDQNKVYPPK